MTDQAPYDFSVTAYYYSGKTVRIHVDETGAEWWVAKDVCVALGISKYRDILSHLEADERASMPVDTPGGKQEVTMVNEPGIYRLITRSKKKEALKFQHWLFHDVLPAIRKTGSYSVQPVQPVAPALPQNYKEALLHLVAQVEENEKLQIENKELTPKAKVYDLVSASKGLVCVSDAAKILNIPVRAFFAKLSSDGIIFLRRNRWVPYANYEKQGWLEVKLVPARDGGTRAYRQTFITPLGVVKLRERYGHPAQQDLFA